jgi:hypothetical protein
MTFCDRKLTINSSESRGKGKTLSAEDKVYIYRCINVSICLCILTSLSIF